MIYQLPSGKCIEISVEYYLKLSDDELQDYVAANAGVSQEDFPYIVTTLNRERYIIITEDFDDDVDLYSDRFQRLDQITPDEKISDTDFFNIDELEL